MTKIVRGVKKLASKIWAAREQWLLSVILILILIAQNRLFNWSLHITRSVSQQAMISAFAIGIFMFGPAIVLRRRARYIWLTIAAFLVELLFVAQYIYFLSFNTFIRGSALRYVSYVGSVGDSIKVQISPLLLLFIVMLPVIGLWYWFVDRKKPQRHYTRKTRLIGLAAVILAFLVCFGGVLAVEQKKHGGLRELLNVPYDNSTMVAKVGVHMYSVLDTYRYFATPRGITEADKTFIE